MLHYVKGDLFKTTYPIIVHGCNAKGIMGSGVAKHIKELYPKAFQIYRKRYEDTGLELGSIQCITLDDHDTHKCIVNAITQDSYGRDGRRYVSYDAVADAMFKLNKLFKHQSIAMPMIGAGLGGGSWKILSTIIETELKDNDVYVYHLNDDLK